MVATRLDQEGLVALDVLCKEFGASRSAALRLAVEMISENISAPERDLPRKLAAMRPVILRVPAKLLVQVIAALSEVAQRYGERSREIYAIGHNVNQLTRLAHATQDLPAISVLQDIEAALVRVRQQLNRDAERDVQALRVLDDLREG